jgi:hypothetical protein
MTMMMRMMRMTRSELRDFAVGREGEAMVDGIEAATLVEEATRELGISLADLIAPASVWVSSEVCQLLEPVRGAWCPDRRRANLGLRVNGNPVEAVGQLMDTLDNNTYANVAFTGRYRMTCRYRGASDCLRSSREREFSWGAEARRGGLMRD